MPRTKVTQYSTPTETEARCQQLQEEYLKPDCPQEIKDEFFLYLREYAQSIALKVIKRLGIFLPPSRVDEIKTDATLLLMSQYSKPGWKVMASFAGAIYWKVMDAMYKQADDERNSSIDFKFTEDSNSKELVDIIDSGTALPWQAAMGLEPVVDGNPENSIEQGISVAYEEIEELIDEAYEMLPYPTFLKFVPWLILQIRKPRTRNINLLFKKTFLSSKEENALDILLLETRNRVAEHT